VSINGLSLSHMVFIMPPPEGRQLYRGEISLNAHQADAVASCDQGGGCEKTYLLIDIFIE
jgi:hypothetical protein